MLARRWIAVLVAAALVALSLVAAGGPANAVGTVGGFEIDGNRVDDAAPEIDWLTPPPNLVSFTDADAADAIDDDIFTGGSKNQEPGGWECGFGSAPQKDDLLSGDIAFRTDPVSGDVFAYVDFFRKARNGSANVDWEFNQSNEPNPACPELPQRTDGDLVIAYDATNGGAVITVRLFEWAFAPGSTTVGAFTEILG
ncbi:MAG TPA: hypothetical protein VNB24_07980, partial [Acidimicrobiales bacterium]|nr:hypothetical protein [Acidimicrobiales bacterium]